MKADQNIDASMVTVLAQLWLLSISIENRL